MTMAKHDNSFDSDAAIEEILSHAPRRPVPSAEVSASVRESVRAEWRDVTGRRRLRGRLVALAAAASLLLAVAFALISLPIPSALPVQVATIDRSAGTIYLVGRGSELEETTNLDILTAGQTLKTGPQSGVSLDWQSGGDLRIDADTRVEFRFEHGNLPDLGADLLRLSVCR